ncbi:MAG: hypothetical protein GX458_06200 [Phyllobacteriaceae bacterium]|nr:hypothetical protein [Phyllobacteriaceae bacterium]
MSIDLAMWFALGVLAAGILALLLMGAVWRRAVRLTTRRVRAALPTDLDEVRAETDLMRAAHAREVRRFELALADLRRSDADARLTIGRDGVEIDRLGEALAEERGKTEAATAELAARAEALADRDRRIARLEEDLAAAGRDGARLTEILEDRDSGIAHLIEEHRRAIADTTEGHRAAVADLTRRHEAAVADLEGDLVDAKAEIAARLATIVAHEAQIRSLRVQVAEASAQLEAEKTAHRLADTATAQEKDRADRLDRRIERLVADVADREERVARMDREMDRARQALIFANARAVAGGGEAVAGDGLARSMAQLEARNHDLEKRLAALGAAGGTTSDGGDDATRAELRGALADLAARIVHLTRVAEGGASPVERILAVADASGAGAPGLADRIRALEARVDAADRAPTADAAAM